MNERRDVVILGGGLAGLSLALQLKRRQPGLEITVLERDAHPVPHKAHKVGESTVEIGSTYFRRDVGMADHLESHQLPKLGLRYFFPWQGNHDVSQRLEYGIFDVSRLLPFKGLPIPTHQIDRGSFENEMGVRARALGVDFRDGTKVERVELSASGHTVLAQDATRETTFNARWVVDASGRRQILRRQLDLAQPAEHRHDAFWWRLDTIVDTEAWSDAAPFRGRMPEAGLRRLATQHLMGRGYWVWLIPLAGGATSVGIVVDPAIHPFETLNSYDKSQAWLRAHEPQLARVLEPLGEAVLDFRAMKSGAYASTRYFSPERWALVGEAGSFLDPFYSPGSDFIAIANTMTTELIERDLSGKAIAGEARAFELFYRAYFDGFHEQYRGSYAMMGKPRAMTAKIMWDHASYFGFSVLLFWCGRLTDIGFLSSLRGELDATKHLQMRAQAAVRRWAEREEGEISDAFVDQMRTFLIPLYLPEQRPLGERDIIRRLREHVRLLGEICTDIERRAGSPNEPAPRGALAEPWFGHIQVPLPEGWA